MNNIKDKKVGIITWHSVKNAYSCLVYLNNSLGEYYDVNLWTKDEELDSNIHGFHSFKKKVYGGIKKVRGILARLDVVLMSKDYDAVIINDLDFFKAGYYIKKLHPNKKVILYMTEINGKDVKYPLGISESFYKSHINYPDMIIDCLKERAEYRVKNDNITKPIKVIDNTIPKYEIDKALSTSINVYKYFTFDNDLPILVYAGGCNLSRSLGDIIDSASKFEDRLNYLFFCYGLEKDYSQVESLCKKHKNCRIYHAIDRTTLLNVMNKCDIGIQYYDPDFSVNHYLAAPSKLFEYLGVGLNVLSSNNRGVDRIINEDDLGVCFTKEEGISGGIERLLNKGLRSREYIKDVFNKKYCYEVDSKEAIEAIKELIEKQ